MSDPDGRVRMSGSDGRVRMVGSRWSGPDGRVRQVGSCGPGWVGPIRRAGGSVVLSPPHSLYDNLFVSFDLHNLYITCLNRQNCPYICWNFFDLSIQETVLS